MDNVDKTGKYILILILNSDDMWEEMWECIHLDECKLKNRAVEGCHGGNCIKMKVI